MWLSFIGLNVLSYLFYLPWEEWWYVRFLMPAFPPMLALTAATLWTLAAPLERFLIGGQRLVAAAAMAGVSWHGVSFSLERGAQLQWIAEQRYKTVGAYVDAALPHRAVLICMQHSGGARFYSGRITVRYDVIEPADLALVVSQLRQLGTCPTSFSTIGRSRNSAHALTATRRSAASMAADRRLDHNRVRIYDTQRP